MAKIFRIIIKITVVIFFSIATLYTVVKTTEWKKSAAGEVTTVSTPATRVAQEVGKSVYAIFNESGEKSALGSGFLYKVDDEKAYLLTNAHVVEEAEHLDVFFETGKSTEAKVVGKDNYYDIAVVSFKKTDLPNGAKVLPIAEGDLSLGEEVLAMGTPLNLSFFNTTTYGVVSGASRVMVEQKERDEDVYYNDFVQIDAAINHGNSGGPLFNLKGEVVGINARGFSGDKEEPISNLGLSIPAYVIRGVLPYIEKGEDKPILSLGLLIDGIYDNSASSIIDKPSTAGNYVAGVIRGSSAYKAGFQEGDVIVEVEGDNDVSTKAIFKKLFALKKGETLEMKIIRKGETKTIDVKLNEMDKSERG